MADNVEIGLLLSPQFKAQGDAYAEARKQQALSLSGGTRSFLTTEEKAAFNASYPVPPEVAEAAVAVREQRASAANAEPPAPPPANPPVVTGDPTLQNGKTNPDGFPVAENSPQSGFINNPPPAGLTDSVFESSSPSSEEPPTLQKKKEDSGLTSDDKRLAIIRPRSARSLYENRGKDGYTSDRGPITTMKLLPGPGYNPEDSVTGAKSDVKQDVKDLVAGKFVNFFLTDYSFALNEKVQVVQTFGDNEVVYYFGRQPIMMSISGLLFDSLENDWFSKMMTLYAGVLRGTQLAKSFSLVEITFPNMVVRGTIAGISASQNSARDTDIPFQMQFIAKEMIPLPVPAVKGTEHNNVGTLVDFKANRQGVAGYTLGTGGLGGGFMDAANNTIGNVTSGMGGFAGSITGALGGIKDAAGALTGTVSGVTGALNAFRTNIFTPVFGIIASITKVVKSVTGTISSIISSFTNPVNQVLRDITSIAAQASGLALLVENSINSVISVPARMLTNLKNTLRSLKGAAGTISRVPENISETMKRLYGSGRIKRGAAILSSGKARQKSKAAVLSSGAPYTPNGSNRL